MTFNIHCTYVIRSSYTHAHAHKSFGIRYGMAIRASYWVVKDFRDNQTLRKLVSKVIQWNRKRRWLYIKAYWQWISENPSTISTVYFSHCHVSFLCHFLLPQTIRIPFVWRLNAPIFRLTDVDFGIALSVLLLPRFQRKATNIDGKSKQARIKCFALLYVVLFIYFFFAYPPSRADIILSSVFNKKKPSLNLFIGNLILPFTSKQRERVSDEQERKKNTAFAKENKIEIKKTSTV